MTGPLADELSKLTAVDAPDLWDVVVAKAVAEAPRPGGIDDIDPPLEFVPELHIMDDERNSVVRRFVNRDWLVAAVAAAAAIALVVGVVVARGDGDNGVVASDATLTPENAIELAESYYAAARVGDVETMARTLGPDPNLVIFDGIPLQNSFTDTANQHLWALAGQSAIGAPDCELHQGVESEVLLDLRCRYRQHLYPARAVGAPVSEWTETVIVAADGIREIFRFHPPSDYEWRKPFDEWIAEFHPDAAAAMVCCDGESVEEATTKGELLVIYGDLWAAYLDETGCSWREPCNPTDE